MIIPQQLHMSDCFVLLWLYYIAQQIHVIILVHWLLGDEPIIFKIKFLIHKME